MTMFVPAAFLALLAVPALAVGALGEPGTQGRGDQSMAFEWRKSGRLMPLDKIVRKVSAQLPGWDYSGFVFEGDSSGVAVYKLIFVREGKVTWIYVDGRNGNTLGRK